MNNGINFSEREQQLVLAYRKMKIQLPLRLALHAAYILVFIGLVVVGIFRTELTLLFSSLFLLFGYFIWIIYYGEKSNSTLKSIIDKYEQRIHELQLLTNIKPAQEKNRNHKLETE